MRRPAEQRLKRPRPEGDFDSNAGPSCKTGKADEGRRFSLFQSKIPDSQGKTTFSFHKSPTCRTGLCDLAKI